MELRVSSRLKTEADIMKMGDLVLKVKRLTSHFKDSIKQAAMQLMGRLTDYEANGAAPALDATVNSTSTHG